MNDVLCGEGVGDHLKFQPFPVKYDYSNGQCVTLKGCASFFIQSRKSQTRYKSKEINQNTTIMTPSVMEESELAIARIN